MTLRFFICNPWESYMRQLEEDTERAERETEYELDLAVLRRRRNRRPLRTRSTVLPREIVEDWDAYTND